MGSNPHPAGLWDLWDLEPVPSPLGGQGHSAKGPKKTATTLQRFPGSGATPNSQQILGLPPTEKMENVLSFWPHSTHLPSFTSVFLAFPSAPPALGSPICTFYALSPPLSGGSVPSCEKDPALPSLEEVTHHHNFSNCLQVTRSLLTPPLQEHPATQPLENPQDCKPLWFCPSPPSTVLRVLRPNSSPCGLGGLTWRSHDLGLANQHILLPQPQWLIPDGHVTPGPMRGSTETSAGTTEKEMLSFRRGSKLGGVKPGAAGALLPGEDRVCLGK